MAYARPILAVSEVATAPSPATSGTSLVLTAGHGASRFGSQTGSFWVTIGPVGATHTKANAEVCIATLSTDTLTLTRAQQGTTARSIIVGDVVYCGITPDDVAPNPVSLFNFATVPDATGEAFFEPYSILATNDLFRHMVLRLGASNAAQPTVDHGVYGRQTIPLNYVGTAPALWIRWNATLTSGNVVFGFKYRVVGGNDTESLDQATYVESLTGTDAAPGTTNRRLEFSIALTAANLAPGKELEFYFYRAGSNGSDTMAGSALVHEALLSCT